MGKSLPGVSEVGDMKRAGFKGSWRKLDLVSREVIGQGSAWGAMETPELKGMWRDTEVCYRVARRESLRYNGRPRSHS